jgi:hypothetical protein
VNGGSFKAAVSAPIDCAWTAVSDSWIAVSPSSGSGGASLSYTVTANEASPRTGAIRVGKGILTVTQEGCSLKLSQASRDVSSDGGRFTVDVNATGAACKWTASSTEPWIEILSPPWRGTGTLSFAVAANTAGARTGRIRIGEQSIEIRQAAVPPGTCFVSVTPSSASVAATGGEGKFSVTTTTDCKWSAATDVSWITITAGTGTGSGGGAYSVRPNDGAERSGRIRIGEGAIEIRQEAAPRRACPESVTPSSASAAATGGEGKFSLTSATDCKWSAVAEVPWITITSGSGLGPGTGTYSVLPNDGPERSGRIRIGDRIIEIRQAPPILPCPQSVAPATASFSAGGGGDKFSVTAPADCKWSASADAPWIGIASGTGVGSGGGAYSVQPNDGPERSGRIRIGERAIEIKQAPRRPCPESVTPTTASFSASGADDKFSVTAAADCKWSASADVAWITITAGSGTGSGGGAYSVRPNDGPERTGRIRIGERAIEIRQAAPLRSCPESVTPATASFTANGGGGKFSVTAAANCQWSASTRETWITITDGAGTGSGGRAYSVAPNDGPERSGRIRIGDQAIGITQAARAK